MDLPAVKIHSSIFVISVLWKKYISADVIFKVSKYWRFQTLIRCKIFGYNESNFCFSDLTVIYQKIPSGGPKKERNKGKKNSNNTELQGVVSVIVNSSEKKKIKTVSGHKKFWVQMFKLYLLSACSRHKDIKAFLYKEKEWKNAK